MRRTLIAAALAATSLFALSGTALAQEAPVAPEFVPPTPAPVTDTTSAANFAEGYATRHAAEFLGVNRRQVRVTDANAVCLQHPVLVNRFGCVFTLRALVIQRSHGWDGWRSAGARGDHPKPKPRHRNRVRIRQFGCLGALSITGGPSVTPTATLRFVECARVPRDLTVAPTPTT